MTRRAWARLDNASNIFLAARNDADPKVFRLSAELDHDVDPARLQRALEVTFDRYPLYHAVLRKGLFWHYLQDSDLSPVATRDELSPCAPLYFPDRRTLLFRVVHHGRRIAVEVFHALSDGTGALWFLTDLLEEYFREPGPQAPGTDPAEPRHELTRDSFAHYFRRRRGPAHGPFGSAAAAPALAVDPGGLSAAGGAGPPPLTRLPRRRVLRLRGTRSPDNRPRVVELSAPVNAMLALARAEGVTLTAYLVALFLDSVRRSVGEARVPQTLTVSVPVNLRQFFPSTSARNFFATTRLGHTFDATADDLGSVSRSLDAQLRGRVTPQRLERKLRRLIRLERLPLLRILPRVVKDAVLALINRANNRSLSVAISNLGRVRLPEPAESHVRRMFLHVSAVRPQFGAVSHDGVLTVSFTSPFTEVDHVREFARNLTGRGVTVTLAENRVTEDELEGVPG